MESEYRVHVYMTGLDKELVNELRKRLGRYVKGAGRAQLNEMMRRAYRGERVLVYSTNNDDDALTVKRDIEGGGAVATVEGLREEEDIFDD